MPSTTVYLGAPLSGKTTLMQEHVRSLSQGPDAPFFFVVDHDDSWSAAFPAAPHVGHYLDSDSWWRSPTPLSIFRGVPGSDVARLAIAVGWSVYVDDEVDGALDDWKESPLREIVKRGRHLRNRAGRVTPVSALIATHRPANLPTDVVGMFDRVYVGRLQGFNDAERVFREGWLPEAQSAAAARASLEARRPGEFTLWP